MLAVAAMSGCGAQSGAPAAAPSAHVLDTQASDAALPVPNRAQALAFANAVNLTTSDIPETRVSRRQGPHTSVAERRKLDREYEACEKPVVHAYLSLHSPDLQRGRELESESFVSLVAFVRDHRSLATALPLLGRASVLRCVAHVATGQLDATKLRFAHWGRVSVTALPVPLNGIPTFGFRMTVAVHISFDEVTVPLYADYLGFAEGHALVGALAVSATQPVPDTTERELIELLHTRAEKHQS
ncbi:MAG TPA: hypothetical protein VHT27_05735 [Solirubrobacteraceae bacterium]|nr:hypothetical protein [Solirubrobacteraceae bacterium]